MNERLRASIWEYSGYTAPLRSRRLVGIGRRRRGAALSVARLDTPAKTLLSALFVLEGTGPAPTEPDGGDTGAEDGASEDDPIAWGPLEDRLRLSVTASCAVKRKQ